MIFRRAACDRCTRTLLDELDGGAPATAVEAALAHLERCDACRREVAEMAPLLAGLRRFGASVRRAEPGTSGWQRLEARLRHRTPPGTRRSAVPLLGPLAGALAVPALALLLLGPAALQGPGGSALAQSPALDASVPAQAEEVAPGIGEGLVAAGQPLPQAAAGAELVRLRIDPLINKDPAAAPAPPSTAPQLWIDPRINADVAAPAESATASPILSEASAATRDGRPAAVAR